MILETDVDDTQCSEQIVDVPASSDRLKESWNLPQYSTGASPEPLHRSSTCQETHNGDGEDRQRFSIPSSKLPDAQDEKIVSRQDTQW